MLIDSGVISDLLHLLKGIPYRLIRTTLSMGLGHEELSFSIERIQQTGFVTNWAFAISGEQNARFSPFGASLQELSRLFYGTIGILSLYLLPGV
jgi:hypothetical protein